MCSVRLRGAVVCVLACLVGSLLLRATPAHALLYGVQPTRVVSGNESASRDAPNRSYLYSINENGSGYTEIGRILRGGNDIAVVALAMNQAGELYGFEHNRSGGMDRARLLRVTVAGSVVTATDVAAGTFVNARITGAGFDHQDRLWVVDGTTDRLRRFDMAALSFVAGSSFALPLEGYPAAESYGGDVAFDLAGNCFFTQILDGSSGRPNQSSLYRCDVVAHTFTEVLTLPTGFDNLTPLFAGLAVSTETPACVEKLYLAETNSNDELGSASLMDRVPSISRLATLSTSGRSHFTQGDLAGYTSVGAATCVQCPNGVVNTGEQCDDGNGNNNDGCSASCTVERGYSCMGIPSMCTVVCGNGIVSGTESCDDGNMIFFDGCSGTCTIDPGYACAGEPSVCTNVSLTLSSPLDGAVFGSRMVSVVGTANAGAQVVIQPSGGIAATRITVDFSGRFSTILDLPDGDYSLDVTATLGFRTATARVSFRVASTTTVTITEPVNGSTNRPMLTARGTAESGSLVRVEVDSINHGTVNAALGEWSVPLALLPAGAHQMRVFATTSIGATGTATVDFSVDASNQIAITGPANGSSTGAQPALSGTTDPRSQVTLVLDGRMMFAVVADAAGSFSIPLSFSLSDGSHTLDATSVDPYGNVARASSTFTVDVSTRISITAPMGTTRERRPTITGTAEPVATVTVVVSGRSLPPVVANDSGNWSVRVEADLPDGTQSVMATARSASGRVATASGGFVVDTQALVTILSPDASTPVGASPTIIGNADPLATVQLTIDGVAVGTTAADREGRWAYAVATELPTGTHELIANVVDSSGNTGSARVSFTVNLATSITITAPRGVIGNELPLITGTAEPDAVVSVRIDGRDVGSVNASSSGRWMVIVIVPLADGSHTLIAIATSPSSAATAMAAGTFTVDTRASVAITSPLADGTTSLEPMFTGTSDPLAAIEVSVDRSLLGTTRSDATGAWAFTTGAPLQVGSHVLSVVATDSVGNTARASANFTASATSLLDTDGDTVPDSIECPSMPCRDTDQDGIPDLRDSDDDGDSVPTASERAMNVDRDTDRDSRVDHLDDDDDGDSVLTSAEYGRDSDNDGLGDALDLDDDGDSIATAREAADSRQLGKDDVDMDGASNWTDADADGDGVSDGMEGSDDSDGDGIPDYLDAINGPNGTSGRVVGTGCSVRGSGHHSTAGGFALLALSLAMGYSRRRRYAQ